jgi:hypothetical protein
MTPVNKRFIEISSPLAEAYSRALRPLALPAVFTRLHLWVGPERTLDGKVHWRFDDLPTN